VYGEIAAQVQTEFTGYEQLAARSRVVALLREGQRVEAVAEGDRIEVVVERTPFYAESGGQVGDAGIISSDAVRVEIEDTQKPVEGLIVHHGRVAIGQLSVGDEVDLEVDRELRAATVRNHSGTHLMHWALREVLGPQVTQAGSLVGPDRLRFDITHDEPLTDDEIRTVEDRVNELILHNVASSVESKPYQAAIQQGAMAMFSEKYGDSVRVVSFGPSVELCGGTHAQATGDIGALRIVGQSAIGAGVRRLEAQTGLGALAYARREEAQLREAAQILRVPPADLPDRVRKLVDRQRQLERELDKARDQLRRGGSADPMQSVQDVGGVKLIATEVTEANPKELRPLVDELKQRLGSGVVLLAARGEDKVALALGVTKDLIGRFKAGDLVKQAAAEVGGSGGGRPDFAQAGGPDVDRLPRALERVRELIASS
jgi:alanyl-tRNA synthetase